MLYHDFLKFELLKIIDSPIFNKELPKGLEKFLFNIEIPNNKEFGDVSTNIAMVLSKEFKLKPHHLAEKISNEIKKNKFIKKIEIVGPGFINFFFKDKFWHNQLNTLLKEIKNYKYKVEKKKICVEFVSANPTGLMHIGHARGAVLGDTIASILEEVGHKVTREYYINDAGEQIKKLINTIIFHKDNKPEKIDELAEDLYPGDYLKEISLKIQKTNDFKLDDQDKGLRHKAVDIIMKDII